MRVQSELVTKSSVGNRLSMGVALLVGVYIAELAGRFQYNGLGGILADIDLRIVTIGVISVWCLAWISVEQPKQLRAPHSLPLLSFFLWLVALVVTGLWADPNAEVLTLVFDLALLGLFTSLAWIIAKRTEAESANILFVVALVTSYLYLGGAIAQGADVTGRLSAFGGGPNVFVRVMIFGALAAIGLAVIWKRYLMALASVPPLIGAVLSGSRGGLLAAILVLVLTVVIVGKRVGWLRFMGATVPVVGLLSILWNLLPSHRREYVHTRILQQTFEERYTSGRDGLSTYAVELFQENVFGGAGLGSFSATYRPGAEGYHAHNLVLSTAAEGGLLSAALLVGALAVAFFALFRRRPLTPQVQFLALFSIFILIASMFSGDYYDSRFMWFFLTLAIVWSAPSRERLAELCSEQGRKRFS